VAPNWDALRTELQLPALTPEELIVRQDVREFMTHEVRVQTNDLASYEQIRRIALIPREFTVESGELSPSMKIKRRVVEQRYRHKIDEAYGVELRASTVA
jgi:long-chain acyl-CoA synthetase